MNEHQWRTHNRIFTARDGMILEQLIDSAPESEDLYIGNRIICNEILRLAEKVAELGADEEFPNRYLADSLRAVRGALQVDGLWTPRKDGAGGTAECAVAAIRRLVALEAALDEIAIPALVYAQRQYGEPFFGEQLRAIERKRHETLQEGSEATPRDRACDDSRIIE